MFIHVFMFRWKSGATNDHKLAARREIQGFASAISDLLEVVVGENLAANDGGYTFGGYMKFKDADAYRAYCVDPLHRRLLEWLVPLIEAIEMDLPGP